MRESELKRIVLAHVSAASGSDHSQLRAERETALDYYYGRPLGNEVEGRSHVVSRDLTDTVEWVLPSLLRVFAMPEVVSFEPVGPEDEQLARQESEYVHHVFMKQNRGFITLYNWFKDALLEKNGYVKYFWDDRKTVKSETYTSLTPEQLLYLSMSHADAEAEIIEQTENEDGTFDVQFKIEKNESQVCVEGIPPEEIIISPNARSDIQKAEFVGHRRPLPRSELIAMGFPKKKVMDLPGYTERSQDYAWYRRRQFEDFPELNTDDDSMDKVEVVEGFILVDYDDDGIAERRRILLAGNEVLENDYCDEVPIAYITPVPLPHQHFGLSYFDLLEDLQKIKTALWRQLLDNAYLANNNRWAVNEYNVNINDALNARVGGIIRTTGNPAQDIVPVPADSVINKILPVLDYTDSVKEQRTGVGKLTKGLDPEVLMNSTKGAIDVAANSANIRIEAIARIFAETGVRDLFLAIHRLLVKNQDFVSRMKLGNGQWMEVRPDLWKDRADLTVRAGIGNNTGDERRSNVMLLGQLIEKAAQAGLVLPENAYNYAEMAAKEFGFPQKGVYFTDPASQKFQQYMQKMQESKEPNPLVQVEQVKTQRDLQIQQMKNRYNYAKLAQDLGLTLKELNEKYALGIAELEVENMVDLAKAGIGAELKRRESGGANQAS